MRLLCALLLNTVVVWAGLIGSGPTLPSACAAGDTFIRNGTASSGFGMCFCNYDSTWKCTVVEGVSATGLPTGGIMMISSGSCPSGYAEAIELNGVMLRGTLAANGDVGTTGGADTITPTGSNSAPSFTGNALAGHLHTFTGSALAGHSHTFAGSALGTHLHGTGTYAASAPTFTGSALATHLHGVGTLVASAPTFTGSALGTHLHGFGTIAADSHTTAATGSSGASRLSGPTTHTISGSTAAITAGTPAGTNSAPALSGSSAAITGGTPSGTNSAPVLSGSSAAVGAGTPAGTLDSISGGTPAGSLDSVSAGTPSGTVAAPAFTGNSFDNRPAFVKVIFCRKT